MRPEEAVRVREAAVGEAREVQRLHLELVPERALTLPRLVIAAPPQESLLLLLLLSRAWRCLLRQPAQ
jgi:hypothetical protein